MLRHTGQISIWQPIVIPPESDHHNPLLLAAESTEVKNCSQGHVANSYRREGELVKPPATGICHFPQHHTCH